MDHEKLDFSSQIYHKYLKGNDELSVDSIRRLMTARVCTYSPLELQYSFYLAAHCFPV